MSSYFVTPRSFIDMTSMGGVQWCTRDYLRTLELAGFQPQIRTFESDPRLLPRLLRRLNPRPFGNEVPPRFVKELIRDCQQEAKSTIFLNNTLALALAPTLRQNLGDRTILIYLSHGVENTDLVNCLRLSPDTLPSHMKTPRWLGEVIFEELRQRSAVDGVICISQEDTVFESWLGAPAQVYLPRTIEQNNLDAKQRTNVIGTVSTLNHGPNLDGIRKLAQELDRYAGPKLRVVGSPAAIGELLQNQFRCLEYLGCLGEEELKSEAATWCAFVNPIFCQARGASTKVATALGWGLPVLTSPVGSRGYRWDDNLIPRAGTVHELVELCHVVATGDVEEWRARAIQLRTLAPSFDEAAERLRGFTSQIAGSGGGPK